MITLNLSSFKVISGLISNKKSPAFEICYQKLPAHSSLTLSANKY